MIERHLGALPGALSAFVSILLCAMGASAPAGEAPAAGKAAETSAGRERLGLVVVVVVDQLRGDSLVRFGPALGSDGILRMAREGIWYRAARYSHACTTTGVGHATIGTGAAPRDHGIPSNDWYERKTGTKVYCAQDASTKIVGTAGETGNASPLNLQSTTFADEWVLSTSGKARAIGISGKDRGAILPIGKTGKAYWYNSSSGRMVSSTYYMKELPRWAAAFSRSCPADAYFKTSWERATRDDDGAPTAADNRDFEGDLYGMGKTFPHPLGKGMEKPDHRFYSQVYNSPFGDRVVMDFAIEAIRAEKLGRGETTDILSISLSANDSVGHTYGPDSVEAKEIFYGVDRQVARLLGILDAEVGPGRYLVALTADHAIAYPPDVVSARGFPTGRLDLGDVARRINRRLNYTIRYLDWSLGFCGPGFYFDPDALRWGGKSPEEIENIAAEVIREATGIAAVFTRSDILAGRLPDNDVGRGVRNGYNLGRSPDVYVVASPYWIEGGTATHGQPYAYDAHVPLVFFGGRLSPAEVFRPVDIRDLAVTLSAVLGSPAPSAGTGTPLEEVLMGARNGPANKRSF
jgi:hypothetical protein